MTLFLGEGFFLWASEGQATSLLRKRKVSETNKWTTVSVCNVSRIWSKILEHLFVRDFLKMYFSRKKFDWHRGQLDYIREGYTMIVDTFFLFCFFNNATWFYIVHASRPVGFIHSTGRVDGMVDCTIPPTPPLPPPFLVHLFVLVSMVIIVILDVLTNNHWFPSRTDLNATGFLRERSCRCTHLMKNISWQ